MKAECAICGKDIEIQRCCSGRECGCMGLPLEPPVCSNKCFKEWVEEFNKKKNDNKEMSCHFLDEEEDIKPYL